MMANSTQQPTDGANTQEQDQARRAVRRLSVRDNRPLAHAMSKDPRKEELKKTWKQREQQKLVASIPMPHQDLRDLFDHLDREGASECDHTHRETIEFLQKRGLDVERIIPWLRQNGGYCDCEVIYNVDDKFGEIVGR